MKNGTGQHEVIVVGGGLAGLAAAAYLGRAGRAVTVLERSGHVGGRAITSERHGFRLNLGPHALYREGAGAAVLRELAVPFEGGVPPQSGYALRGGALERLSSSPWWFVTTRLLGPAAKLEAARLLVRLRWLDHRSLARVSWQDWLEREARRPAARELLAALARVATYANDPARMSAGLAVFQLQLALRGVLYLHGGWQTLVDGLRGAAEAAGARIVAGAKATAVRRESEALTVRLDDGSALPASAVIVAAGPAVAVELLGEAGASLRRRAGDAEPVRAACLDVGLRALPRPRVTFALGLDRPLYFSVHSAVARLAQDGGATIHVATYLPTGDRAPAHHLERELEGVLDVTQPGWRELVAERRLLPTMTVVNALPSAAQGGLAGRPGPDAAGVPDVYVAGDWVGPEGWLSDASLASAKRAAELALGGGGGRASNSSTESSVGAQAKAR